MKQNKDNTLNWSRFLQKPKGLLILLAVLGLMLIGCKKRESQESAFEPKEKFKIEINGREVAITKYTGTAMDIKIPPTIDGRTVVEISDDAFAENNGIVTVEIPSGVKIIGEGAFRDCSCLESVTIPSSVLVIGPKAFAGCEKLTSVDIPSSVEEIGDDAFEGCKVSSQLKGSPLNGLLQGFGQNKNMSAQARETEYQKVMTRQLGLYLKEKYSGKKAIIIKDPYSKDDSPLMVGLSEGLGDALNIVDIVYPEPPKSKGDPEMEMMDPMETWYTKKALENLLKYKDVDLIITTIGLPIGVLCGADKEFNAYCLKGKKVVFAGGSIYEHGCAFRAGCLAAAVTYKPNAEYDEKPVPKDQQAAFDKRFLLVTSENYQEVMRQHPDIFEH